MTPRGRSSRPEFTYAVDGGTLGTLRQDVSLGGLVGRVDYYADASRFETDNDLPNNAFRSNTFAGRVGVSIGRSTDLGFTVRHVDAVVGLPGPVRFTGVADDSRQDQRLTVFGVTAKSQLTDRLRTAVRLTLYDRRSEYVNASPSGEPFDLFGFGVNYLGAPVTIVGGNGLTVSGQPILDFGGVYPSLFDSSTFRQSAWGQADYRLFDVFELSGGVRVEHEEGSQAGPSIGPPPRARTEGRSSRSVPGWENAFFSRVASVSRTTQSLALRRFLGCRRLCTSERRWSRRRCLATRKWF